MDTPLASAPAGIESRNVMSDDFGWEVWFAFEELIKANETMMYVAMREKYSKDETLGLLSYTCKKKAGLI